jgi:AmmeMemoRadiSam system protein A
MAYTDAINESDKRELLRIARITLREYAYAQQIPPGKPHRESLLKDANVFVTLKRGKALRGCIGNVDSTLPLYRAVQEMAIAAATRDPRFAEVTDEELDHLEIELSVLGERAPVSGPGDIKVGRDGLMIELGGRRGLLLPQVASERGWDTEAFLAALCEKAGLPAESWSNGEAKIERFSAQVFGEDELGRSH